MKWTDKTMKTTEHSKINGPGTIAPAELDPKTRALAGPGISYDAAVAAHNGTSFVPERRAEQRIAEFRACIERDWDELAGVAESPELIETVLLPAFERYREKMRSLAHAYLHSRSRVVSSMIAGPSNFPVRMMQKRNAAADRRYEVLSAYRERFKRRLIIDLQPSRKPIRTEDADAADRLAEKITEAEARRDVMKAANKVYRSKKLSAAEKVAAVVALGIDHRSASLRLQPDFCGRIGFPNWEISNLGANIRRMKERVPQIERAQSSPTVEAEGANGIRFEDCPAENRVRLYFPGKPSAEIRADLKRRGFRWSPTNGAWQAYRKSWAIEHARKVADVEKSATVGKEVAA